MFKMLGGVGSAGIIELFPIPNEIPPAMPISRRTLLGASALTPFVSSCAVKTSALQQSTARALAIEHGISATYVILRGGKAMPAVVLPHSATAAPVQPQAVFQAASLTKQVVAFTALQLVREGKLELHAPVSLYLPDGYQHRQNPFASPAKFDLVKPELLAQIPVSALLNHTSGLPNWASGELRPSFPAGEKWQYSGEAFILLQAVISAITGQDSDASVRKYVFEPLGMRQSSMRITDSVRRSLVPSTGRLPWDRPREFAEPNAAASLYTTAEDYARLMARWVTDDALLALTLAKPVVADVKLGLSWGYGWGVEQGAGGPYLWQWGNNPGYRTFAMMSSSTRDGFVLLTNSPQGMKLAQPLAREVTGAEQRVFRFHMLG